MDTFEKKKTFSDFVLGSLTWESMRNDKMGFLYSTKRRNEITKSLNDNTWFGVVGSVPFFIFHKVGSRPGSRLGTEWYRLSYMLAAVLFPI